MKVVMGEASNFRSPAPVGSHAYARAFASAGHDVLWIGTPLNPATFVRHPGHVDVKWRTHVWRRGGVRGDVEEYYPLTLLPVLDAPVLRSSFAINNTLRWTVPRIESIARRRGFGRPDLLWLSQSRFALPLLDVIPARKTAYRMSDDWGEFRGVPHSLVRAEETVVDRVDAVFVTSRILQEKVRRRRDDVVYLPNAAAECFFDDDAAEPALVAGLRRPRVVFVGTLSYWVDVGVIRAIARAIPDADVLLVGPVETPLDDLPGNVHTLGAQPQGVLPGLLRHCDAAIIPFVPSELTQAVNPVKLFEYLATGVPVVASRLREMESVASPALLCDGTDDFVAAVSGVLDSTIPWDADAARRFARAHTWQKRFETVMQVLS